MSYDLLESQVEMFLKTAGNQPRARAGRAGSERLDELGERE